MFTKPQNYWKTGITQKLTKLEQPHVHIMISGVTGRGSKSRFFTKDEFNPNQAQGYVKAVDNGFSVMDYYGRANNFEHQKLLADGYQLVGY